MGKPILNDPTSPEYLKPIPQACYILCKYYKIFRSMNQSFSPASPTSPTIQSIS